MIRFYGDCSGKAKDRVVLAAGYLGNADQWASFEDEWIAALREAHVHAFHGTDFYSHRGEFKEWSRQQENKFAKRFTAIAERQLGIGVAVGVDVPAFNEILADELRRLPGTPHRRFTPLMHAVSVMLNKVRRMAHPLREPIAVIMEEEDGIGEVIEYVNALKRQDRSWAETFVSFTTAGKELVPLQAADLLAHEAWRRVNEYLAPQGRGVRKSLQRLLRRRKLQIDVVSRANMLSDLPKFQHFLASRASDASPSESPSSEPQ